MHIYVYVMSVAYVHMCVWWMWHVCMCVCNIDICAHLVRVEEDIRLPVLHLILSRHSL